MVGTNEHTPKARLLGAELRESRKNADLTVRELAAKLGTSHVTISRYETGARIPQTEDVARILAILGVTGSGYEELMDFARNAGDRNTFARSSPRPHKHLLELAEFERSATSIVDVAPKVIPGLLQTADYAREVMRGLPAHEREVRVGLRMARRDVLTRRKAPQLTAFIFEHALREPLGGYDVMADQLRSLVRLVDRDNVTIVVVPNGLTRWTPAHDGAFVLYEFRKARPMIQLENYRAPAFLSDTKDVSEYKEALLDLKAVALAHQESVGLIASIAEEMEGN